MSNERDPYPNEQVRDAHMLANLAALDGYLEEGVITPKEYKRKVYLVAKKFNKKPNDLVPGIESSWHIYSAATGLRTTNDQLLREGWAAFGINGNGRIVPVDEVTQVFATFEDELKRWNPRLTKKARNLYDHAAREGRAASYPLLAGGILFELAAPILKKSLTKNGCDKTRYAYSPLDTPQSIDLARTIVDRERNHNPLYKTVIFERDKGPKPYILVYPKNLDYTNKPPEWITNSSQRELFRNWSSQNLPLPTQISLSNAFSFSDFQDWCGQDMHYPPISILGLEEAREKFIRPNGEKFTRREFNRMPSYTGMPFDTFRYNIELNPYLQPPDIFHPHLVGSPKS